MRPATVGHRGRRPTANGPANSDRASRSTVGIPPIAAVQNLELHACRSEGLRQSLGELTCRSTGYLHPVGHSGWIRAR